MSSRQQLGCVLAGGRSSRMGQDKAMLLYGGSLLIERAVERLKHAGCEPVIAASRPDLARYAPVLEDLHPACGPLSGIEAALAYAAADFVGIAELDRPVLDRLVLSLPVDLPLLPAGFLSLLLDRAERTGALATIPMVGGFPQPLCAVYRCALLPGISRALDAGDYKVMRVIAALAPGRSADLFGVESLLASLPLADADLGLSGLAIGAPRHLWFANINTPGDLQALPPASL